MSSGRESASSACYTMSAAGWPARSIAALAGQHQVAERTPQECWRLWSVVSNCGVSTRTLCQSTAEGGESSVAAGLGGTVKRVLRKYMASTSIPMDKSRFGDPGAVMILT